ncbi:MAG: aldo/keto reductase, partial [Bacteroidota bacterium]
GDWGAKLSSEELERFIDGCLDLGLRDFDHADIYGGYTAESDFGKVLQRRPDLRNKIQLTTKCGIRMVTPNRPNHKIASYDSGQRHIMASVENSLRELHIEKIDLLLIHRPDFLMDPQEIAAAFSQLQIEGKVDHFGVSNFTPSQFEMLNQFTPLVNNQIEASITHLDPFENGQLDQCIRLGVTPSAWSPLGGGTLFTDFEDPKSNRIRAVANRIAEEQNASLDQVLLAFLLKHPSGIVPVLGTSKLSRVESALGAIKIEISKQDWYELWQASKGEPIP